MAYLKLVVITVGLFLAAASVPAPPLHRQTTSPAITRVPNTTLALPSAPPQFGYTVANAFPGVTLTHPLCIVSPPGETNRPFILEQGGNIVVITNPTAPTRTVFMR